MVIHTWIRGPRRNHICRNACRGPRRTTGNMPSECHGSAMDPLRIPSRLCYKHAAKDVPRTKVDEICWYYYGYVCGVCDGCAIDVPWVDFCMVLKTDVVWMCYVYANRLPMMCYGGGYMDWHKRTTGDMLLSECHGSTAMLRACYGCPAGVRSTTPPAPGHIRTHAHERTVRPQSRVLKTFFRVFNATRNNVN